MQTGNALLGIEIGGTKLQLAKGPSTGGFTKKLRYTINSEGGAASIQDQLSTGVKEMGLDDITAIGVGFGGPVDWKNGVIRVSHQVGGWGDFPFVQWLQELTGKPVAIENDANTAALAEARHGSGKGHERVFYMTIGSGIGGGLIVNGEVYHGRNPGEVEVGHLRLNKQGDTLEDRCSGWAVNKKVRTVIDQQPDSVLAKLFSRQQGPESVLLIPALEEGDPSASQIMAEVADDLAFALSHVVHLFHPDVMVIGGGLSLLGDYLLQPVRDRLPAYTMKAFLPLPELKAAALGEDVVPLGALEVAKTVLPK